jgi:hypothetical protein
MYSARRVAALAGNATVEPTEALALAQEDIPSFSVLPQLLTFNPENAA